MKIVLIALMGLTGYGVTIFAAPEVASSIDNLIGLPGLSDSIRGKKVTIENAVTDIPSIDTLTNGAVDIGVKITDGVDKTKDTIDTIRSNAQKAEETYNDVKQSYDDVKEVYDSTKDKIEQFQGVLDSVETLTGTGS